MTGWYVIKFPDENTIEVVPENWISNNKKTCVWPPYVRGQLLEAIKSKEEPAEDWTIHNIDFLSKKLYEKFLQANSRATKAKFTSDVSSAAETLQDNSSSSEELNTISDTDSSLEFPEIPTVNKRNLSQISVTPSTSAKKKCIRAIGYSGSLIESQIEKTSDRQNENTPSKLYKTSAQRKMMKEIRTSPLLSTVQTNKSLKHLKINDASIENNDYSIMNFRQKDRDEDNNQTDTFQKQVLKQLVSIKMQQKENTKTLESIMNWIHEQKNNAATKKELQIDQNREILNEFPINEDVKLALMDELLEIKENFETVVSVMAQVGRENVGEFIRRVMSRLLTNELAMNYSWQGHKEKKILQIETSYCYYRSNQEEYFFEQYHRKTNRTLNCQMAK